MALFENQGLSPIPAPTNHFAKESRGGDLRRLIPNSQNLATLRVVMHEWLGLMWAQLRGRA